MLLTKCKGVMENPALLSYHSWLTGINSNGPWIHAVLRLELLSFVSAFLVFLALWDCRSWVFPPA